MGAKYQIGAITNPSPPINNNCSPCVPGKYRFKVQTRSDDGIGSDRDIHRTISTMKSKKISGLF